MYVAVARLLLYRILIGVGCCSEEGEPEAQALYHVNRARPLTYELDALGLNGFGFSLDNSQTPALFTTRRTPSETR